MIARRDLIIGALCLGSVGVATALKPRRHVSVLGDTKVESVVPKGMSGWTADASEGLVKPKVEGLAASLYDEVVQRTYIDEKSGDRAMLLVAHGGSQSDLLQLHRPEVCYPALGFIIASKKKAQLTLPGGGVLPIVELVATTGDRRENIIYWTRLGESFPTSGSEQRTVLLKSAMAGFVPDGVLVRASMIDSDSDAAFARLRVFIPTLIEAITPSARAGLVGTQIARMMT